MTHQRSLGPATSKLKPLLSFESHPSCPVTRNAKGVANQVTPHPSPPPSTPNPNRNCLENPCESLATTPRASPAAARRGRQARAAAKRRRVVTLLTGSAFSKHQRNMQVCAVFHMLPVSPVVFGKRCCCPSHSRAACFSGSNAQRDLAFHGLLSRRRGLVRFLHAYPPIFILMTRRVGITSSTRPSLVIASFPPLLVPLLLPLPSMPLLFPHRRSI